MAAPKKPSGSNYKSDKIWRDALHRAVKRVIKDEKDGTKTTALELLADTVVLQGIGGNIAAAKGVGDRLDGKAAQAVTMTTNIGENFVETLKLLQQIRDAESAAVDPPGAEGEWDESPPVRH